jgi:hypothetical protein
VFGDGLRSLGSAVLKGKPFVDLQVVATKASPETIHETDLLVEAVRAHFQPTADTPSPSTFFYRHSELLPFNPQPHDLPDVAAVVAGIKPAALLLSDEIFPSPHGRELLLRATQQGYVLATEVTGDPHARSILFVGHEENVKRLAAAYHELNSLPPSALEKPRNPKRARCDREIGRALGYPAEPADKRSKEHGDPPHHGLDTHSHRVLMLLKRGGDDGKRGRQRKPAPCQKKKRSKNERKPMSPGENEGVPG